MPDNKDKRTAPLKPVDVFANIKGVDDAFANVTTKEMSRQGNFDASEFEFVNNPSYYDDKKSLKNVNLTKQPFTTMAVRSINQFGANFISSIGQGLANTFDLINLGKTIGGEFTGSNDTFESNLFGLSTSEMQDWANGVAARNKIYEREEGSFNPSDPGWWAKQFASSGTGVGMAVEALGTTALIEWTTGGLGTAGALAKLSSAFSKLRQGARGLEVLNEAAHAARGLKSAATVYATISRLSEGRMGAMNSYREIYNELSSKTKEDGSGYSEQEKQELASAGARRTFNGNLLLLPLDILAFRTMVYNPISGTGTGLIERGLGAISNKLIRKGTQGVVFAGLEGSEEGFQFIAEQEGKHYARVLGGYGDDSSFSERVAKNIQTDEFWNNFAGGVIGSPIIAGSMKLVNTFVGNNRQSKLNQIHKDYVQNIGKMDSAIATTIKKLEGEGKVKEASVLRRQFAANKALSALHLDAMTDRETAFDAHVTFLSATLGELNEGKTDALTDLGFASATPEQVETIKEEFQNYIKDAQSIKNIYDTVKTQYNKNFVPEITQDYFQLEKLVAEETEMNKVLAEERAKIFQFGSLSSSGQQIYDAEYKLQALEAEKSRLINLARNPKGALEQIQIDKLIDENNAKISRVKEQLDDLNKNSEYSQEDKSKDADIINSALVSQNYLQAIYNKERLDNAISLKRKNIALWSNPDFIAEKTQQAVKAAKTKAQVEATEETLSEDDKKTKEALEEKKKEIAANEAAEAVKVGEVPGNASLFAEENEHINSISSVLVDSDGSFNEGQVANAEPEYLFTPQNYDFEKSSDEAKTKITSGVRGLLDKLSGDKTTFEELIRHIVKVQGQTTADKIFNAVKYGWTANNMPEVDFQAVYNNVFGNPLDELMAGASQLLIQNEKQLNQATNKTLTEVVAKESKPEFDNNNQPVYEYKGIITNESSPKLAFTSRLTDLIQTQNEDGTITVSHEYTQDELNTGEYVDSLALLDPDTFNEGTELVIKVPSNFNEIKIPVYNADGTKGQSMTFGQYVAMHNLTPEMQEYQDKVPMIIYRKNTKPDEKGLAFVHDIGWYHPLRFNQEKPDDMKEAISQTRDIRKEVLEDKNNATSIIITGKRQTTFAGLKTKDGATITLREANPQTQLTVALTSDTLSTSKKNTVFPNNETVLVNNSPFKKGQIIEVRRYGFKDGKKTYIGFPVLRQKIDELSKSSVVNAITIYSNRTNQTPAVRQIHDKVVKHIQDTMGIDILSAQGLEDYLQHFITTFNTEKAKTNEDVEQQAKAKLAAGTPYIAFIAGGNIVFGRAGEAAYATRDGVKKGSFFINPNAAGTATSAINNLNKPTMLGWYEQNLDLENLNRNKPVVTIDKAMNSSIAAPTYNDFLLDRLHTNVRSHNIGTEENPNYVTNIQPVITYDTSKRLQRTTSTTPVEQFTEEKERREENSNNTEEQVQQGEQQNLKDIEAKILAEAKAKLGNDFGISKSTEGLFSPSIMTEDQRNEIAANINRIAGLTPNQQFDIVDFMYNQITAMVNLENKMATKAEVDKQVKKAFDEVISPLKEEYKAEVKRLQDLIKEHPALKESGVPDVINDYNYRLGKIKSIEDNFEVLRTEAYNRVAKYTGITQTERELTPEELAVEGDDGTDTEVDFWTDVLQESPENKLSYSMRRFFGQIRATDKTGKPATGFLGLPTYVGSDHVTRTLMVTLADVPSNFDAMLARLEDRKAGIPWMQEVIDKLKAADTQRRNQFVTVMSNTSLRMKFTMISYNRKTGSWTTKVYDTNLNGVANAVKEEWRNNFADSSLVLADEEGNYKLNTTKAESLIHKFESWKGLNLKPVQTDMTPYRDSINGVKNDTTVTITPTGALLQELKTNLVKNTDRMKFSMKGFDYQITNIGNNKFKISFLKQSVASKEEVTEWLREFGIVLSPGTIDELFTKGLFHNYKQHKFVDLFDSGSNTNGLFGILYNKLKILTQKEGFDFTEYGDNPLDESVINSLANLEAKYNDTQTPFGFRDNGKSFFALTAPKFITDRVRDLKAIDSNMREQLLQISFSQNSFWLRLLNDSKFRDKFNVSHIGANAFKELGKKIYRDNSLTKLSDVDHELTKLGMFWDMTQGEVSYTTPDGKAFSEYPDTNIQMRMATMFSPTMSDKHMMTLLTTAVLNLQNKDLNDGQGISAEVSKVIYEQCVKPELARMVKFFQNGGSTNIKDYDKGAGLFLLLPELNNLEYTEGLKLIDAIKHRPNDFTVQFVENNQDLMKKIYATIEGYVSTLTDEKMAVWDNNGFFKVEETVDNTNNTQESKVAGLRFFDRRYLDKFRGTNEQKAKMAAMDFVVNSMLANANSFMLMAGDPALYYKSKATDPIQQAKDTFVNVGKRLANQIAPGTTLADSENEKYIQVFINDRVSTADNIEYLEQILGKEGAAAYRKIEGSDAQEYTTWQEHLDILARLGKTPDALLDISPEDIQEAREIFASGKEKSKLTERELQLIGKVMQPIKPVYTGQIYDKEQDVMRTVYIKSSSFPLIPQLTAGFEIDKLRVAMEHFQANAKMNVRASYQTANKVGSVKNAATIWNEDGTISKGANGKYLHGGDLSNHALILDRKNFRIQQEVPFKSGKNSEDKITLGTQLMKLLFGDEMMNFSGFTYNGKEYTGKELQKTYNELFIQLVQEKRKQLFSELGLDDNGVPTDANKSMMKLQQLLKEEAVKRGYPLQDVEGLTINNGEFVLPLWSSSNSNRYESMLNSIITNRIVRMKFPGNSYVVGSEEGFVTTKIEEGELDAATQSRIVYTSAWNGSHLQASYHADGRIKKAQVFAASKFRDQKGNLIDLFTKENGQYKYITKNENGSYSLKEDMFDKELLSYLTFRIPTSGHQSGSEVEIVGFLPHVSADLMIVPKNFTKQKGLDFDVDKENAYHLWTFMDENGKFNVLSEEHRDKLLLAADKDLQENSSEAKLIKAIFGDELHYSEEDIKGNKVLEKVNSKITEKILQNEIIRIKHSVFNNPNPEVQAKIVKTLNTDYAEAQADFIESLSNMNKDSKYWTPLSDEYQKQKMALGASGKIGTGAYSLDVTFHSLAQQAAINGKPITLTEVIGEGDDKRIVAKVWKFGRVKSTGVLGGTTTLDGSRSISEVMAERQNVAVDNEKLQVMGRVGLNDLTMDVDKVFNMVGFDKGEDGNSIAFLFLSQPIIKEYVELMKNASSNMAEFEQNKEARIVDELLRKYEGDLLIEDIEQYNELMSEQMTNANFITAIQSDKPDGKLQGAVLRRFIEMKTYGIALRGIQTTINTDSKGLGKSFFDVIERRNALNKLGADTSFISGASGLIGEFENLENIDQQRIDDLKAQGYIDIGKFLVKPNTLSGAFNVYGITTAYNLWSKYFPYDAAVTLKAFQEVLSVIGNDNLSDTKAVELKQEIFRGMKKYFAASKLNGIIAKEDDINEERKRLFIDSEENTSLARYLKTIKAMTGNAAVDTFIKTNKLINRFEFEVKKNGEPSLIKYNNAAGEEFDEQYLYESLATLMEIRGKNGSVELPQVGNKKYTLDTLAQDLIAYCYLGNAVQEAIQFTKYVPVSYLNVTGYAGRMRTANMWLQDNPNILGLKIATEKEKHLVSEFTMQYIQHNPERVKYKLDGKKLAGSIVEANSTDINKLETFKLKTEDKPSFISIYNSSIPKGEKKFQLYWFDGDKYTRIPVLGTFGMDEYQPRNSIGTSLVNGRVRIKADPQAATHIKVEDSKDILGINTGNIQTVLEKAASSTANAGLKSLATVLLPFVNSDIKIAYAEQVGEMKGFQGLYQINSNTIYINPNDEHIKQGTDNVIRTLLHEVVHSLTVNQINRYITENADGSVNVSSDAPAYVSNLVRLYNDVRSKSDTKELKDILDKVKAGKGIDPANWGKYGLTSIYEFIAEALTNPEFQQYLAKSEFKQSGMTLLDKFKQVIAELLNSIGVTFESNTATAQAINSIFEFIESSNSNLSIDEVNTELNYGAWNENDYDQGNMDFLNRLDDELNDGPVEGTLLPSEFPVKTLNIKNLQCL